MQGGGERKMPGVNRQGGMQHFIRHFCPRSVSGAFQSSPFIPFQSCVAVPIGIPIFQMTKLKCILEKWVSARGGILIQFSVTKQCHAVPKSSVGFSQMARKSHGGGVIRAVTAPQECHRRYSKIEKD